MRQALARWCDSTNQILDLTRVNCELSGSVRVLTKYMPKGSRVLVSQLTQHCLIQQKFSEEN